MSTAPAQRYVSEVDWEVGYVASCVDFCCSDVNTKYDVFDRLSTHKTPEAR